MAPPRSAATATAPGPDPAAGAPIAWLGDPWGEASWTSPEEAGRWGAPGELGLPLDDRGLLLADGLFETLRVEGGRARLLEAHRARWREAALLLDLAPPPPAPRLEALLRGAVARTGAGDGALRLNVSRGSGGRGLEPLLSGTAGAGPRFWLIWSPGPAQFAPVRLVLSRLETRNAASLLSRCKTFAYGGPVQARREARARGADDALLASSAGGLCCATAANLLVRRGGRWHTPPAGSGCLPGILRGLALAQGLAEERPLEPPDLLGAEGALLINSLGCRPVSDFEGHRLPAMTSAQAEALWRGLMERGEGPVS